MALWPFGKDAADVELASRVITAAAQNGYRVRGKLTIHFAEPQRQADADEAADRCASAATALLREAQDHQHLIGAEAQLSSELSARYPAGVARARAVELAALHVLGDPALSDDLRRASLSSPPPSFRPSPPSTPPAYSAAPPSSGGVASPNPTRRPSAAPPSAPAPPPRRRGSSQLRSLQSLLMPPGTPPSAMGAFVSPLLRDSAARLLIGFLRAHDLIGVRGIAVDDSSAELLASLVPISDAPPGGYEASRSAELLRWQGTLGQGALAALRREACVVGLHLSAEAMRRIDVPQALSLPVLDALANAAFPDMPKLIAEIGRYPSSGSLPLPGQPYVISPGLCYAIAANLTRIASGREDPAGVSAALSPLIALVLGDLDGAAMVIRASAGYDTSVL